VSDFICIVMGGPKSPDSSWGSVPAIGSGSGGAPDGRDRPGHDGKKPGHDGKKPWHDGEKPGHSGKDATRS
jgi:hypothetical protein